MRLTRLLLFSLLSLLSSLVVSSADVQPADRIVSMNLCTDQMALLLVDRSRLLSVSFLAADPEESPLAHMTEGLHMNYGEAEEIIALNPDLVLTGRHTTGFAKTVLRQLGYPVLEVDNPKAIQDVHTTFIRVGKILGVEDRAIAMLRDMDLRLTALADWSAGRVRPTALVYDANGFSMGAPSLVDDIMSIVGFNNLATNLGVGEFGQASLEAVLVSKPDIIIRLTYRPESFSLASQAAQHRAIRTYLSARPTISIRSSFSVCGTPQIVDLAEQFMSARRRLIETTL